MNDKHIYTINTNEAEVFLSVIYNPFLKSFKEKHPDIKVNNIVDEDFQYNNSEQSFTLII